MFETFNVKGLYIAVQVPPLARSDPARRERERDVHGP
jgi:hypothetical protein